MEGLEKYGDEIFYPIIKISKKKFKKEEFDSIIEEMINKYIKNHKLSKTAHEEIMAMTHSDKDTEKYYYESEIKATESITNYLIDNGFNKKDLKEKVHVMIGLIDNLCHEVIYHKHESLNYEIMKEIVIKNIKNIFKNDLE